MLLIIFWLGVIVFAWFLWRYAAGIAVVPTSPARLGARFLAVALWTILALVGAWGVIAFVIVFAG